MVKTSSQINNYSSRPNTQDLLHVSILPTDYFQKSLLRLPIPKLEKTCERYLKAQEVILTPDEYKKTEGIVKQFKESWADNYDNVLRFRDKENSHTSYVSDFWFDMYLSSRDPIVLNFNPFMSFQDDPRKDYQTQLLRATNMVISSLRYFKTFQANVLEPEVFHLNPGKSDTTKFRKIMRIVPESLATYFAYAFKAYPLDMSQYTRLFHSTRIPRLGKDELVTDTNADHILVMRNGHYYVFKVYDSFGRIIPASTLMTHLNYILQDKTPPPELPVGVLTAENRNTWATVREQLLKAGNEKTLKMIDSAAFILTLDDCAPTDPNKITRNFLHGDGTNRWFDKSFSLILTKDGIASVNFEHSWGDGVAVVRYFNEVYKDSTEKPQVHPGTPLTDADSSKSVQRLEFKLDENIKEAIRKAKSNFDKFTGSLDIDYLEYKRFTKKEVKKQKISPDSVMQLAIQMAYYRQYGKFVATYESCSTAAFKHGRTETVRSATMATKKACKMIVDKKSSATSEELREALNECSKVHSQLTKEAAMGQGFDRHLFAIRKLAEMDGKTLPMFADPSYTKINHNILSTSTVTSPAINIGGFAPVVSDGYGVGYSIEDNRIGYNVTSYPPATNSSEFVQCLKDSLDSIHDIFEGRSPKK